MGLVRADQPRLRAAQGTPFVDIRGLIGLLGVLIAAVVAEFNDQVTSVALADIQGGLRISHDPGTWFGSLYISAEIVGMAISPWMLVTFTLRRWTLSVIGLSERTLPPRIQLAQK